MLTNLAGISRVAWFGDSWTYGSELEKSITGDYTAADQDLYRETNRFSAIVSQAMSWREQNLAVPGISPDRLVAQVADFLASQSDLDQLLIMVVWPSFTRYTWVDDRGLINDVRIADAWNDWYRVVDNYFFQIYAAQRSVWALEHFLGNQKVQFLFTNSVYQLRSPLFFKIDPNHWIKGIDFRISDLLDFNVDKGYPTNRHRYLWPAENHPNFYGHKCIANHIITFLQENNNERT